MTYLELVRRLAQESGAAGTPSSVTGQVGEHKRLVDWTKQAWDAIQNKFTDWNWLRDDFSFVTTEGKRIYSATEAGITTRFGNWDADFIKIYKTADGLSSERLLSKKTFPEYRNQFQIGDVANDFPTAFCLHPNRGLALGPVPNADEYTVSGAYFKSPQALSANSDEPECPAQFHEIIVWRAMLFYARYEAAPEIYQDAEINYNRMFAELVIDQRPNMSAGTFI